MRIHLLRSLLIMGGFALFLVTWLDLLSIPPCATDTLFRLLELTYVWLIYPGYIHGYRPCLRTCEVARNCK
jgi:hypothetical protein